MFHAAFLWFWALSFVYYSKHNKRYADWIRFRPQVKRLG